jgi:hypothetical protein
MIDETRALGRRWEKHVGDGQVLTMRTEEDSAGVLVAEVWPGGRDGALLPEWAAAREMYDHFTAEG